MFNFFKTIGGNPSGNVFYSPVSISSALAMESLGARGNTADQMYKVLSFKGPGKAPSVTPEHYVDQINSSYKKFMSELNKPGVPNVLSLANRLYGEQSYQFKEKYLKAAEKNDEAGLEKVDFKSESEAARVNINKYVENTTQEKIKDLVPRGGVNDLTRLAVVNAIYFSGTCMKAFPMEATRDELFKLNRTQTKPVKMMYQTAKFRLAIIPEINSQVLELPYVGDLSMLIVLPRETIDESTGLLELENKLLNVRDWTGPSNASQQLVQVSLPRFTMKQSNIMNRSPDSMSVENVSEVMKVSVSGMTSNKDLVLSQVIHEVFVEINEEGTIVAEANININIMKTGSKPSGASGASGTSGVPLTSEASEASLTFGAPLTSDASGAYGGSHMNLSPISMEDFSDKINFSDRTSHKHLVLSKVNQKAFIKINNEETEEAAAMATIRKPNRMEFKADHPFLFFIRHNSSNTILFCGRFCSP